MKIAFGFLIYFVLCCIIGFALVALFIAEVTMRLVAVVFRFKEDDFFLVRCIGKTQLKLQRLL